MINVATEPHIFFYMVSLAVTVTITPQLILSKVCHEMYNDTVCNRLSNGKYKNQENIVYEKAAFWNIINLSAVYIPSAITVLFFRPLSDIVNRKKLLLIVPIATTMQNVVYIFSACYMSSSIWLVAFGTSLTCVFADIQGAKLLEYSYLANVTAADENRTVRMTILSAVGYLSQGISSCIMGILLKRYGFLTAFSFSTIASAANFSFTAFILPDKIASEQQKSESTPMDLISLFRTTFDNSKLACKRICRFMKTYVLSWKERRVLLILLAAFFTNSTVYGENIIIAMFLKHRPLGLSPVQIGTVLLTLQLVRGFGVLLLTFISRKLVKLSDFFLILAGQISMISIFVAFGLFALEMLFAVTPLSIGFPFAMSGLRSALTKLVLPEENGTALSFLAFFSLIGKIIMTFAANKIFQAVASYFTGACMIFLAIVCLIGIFFTLVSFYTKNGKSMENQQQEDMKMEDTLALLDPKYHN